MIGVAVVAVVAFAGWRVATHKSSPPSPTSNNSQSNNTNTMNGKPIDNTQPVLHNLGLSGFAPYDSATGRAGPIQLNTALEEYKQYGSNVKPFDVFGITIPNHPAINNTLDFAAIAHGTPVYAAMDGIVRSLDTQHSPLLNGFVDDYEITLATNDHSAWSVDYDHIQNVLVKKGDYVKAGQQIATTASHLNGTDRFEFGLWRPNGKGFIDGCPLSALDSSVQARYISQIKQLELDVNNLFGSQIYDLAQQNPVGCAAPQINDQSPQN